MLLLFCPLTHQLQWENGHEVECQNVVYLFFPSAFEQVDINSYCSLLAGGFQTDARTNKHDLLQHAAIEKSRCPNP